MASCMWMADFRMVVTIRTLAVEVHRVHTYAVHTKSALFAHYRPIESW